LMPDLARNPGKIHANQEIFTRFYEILRYVLRCYEMLWDFKICVDDVFLLQTDSCWNGAIMGHPFCRIIHCPSAIQWEAMKGGPKDMIWLVLSNMCFFHNIWDSPSHWLIFFKTVKITSQWLDGTWVWLIYLWHAASCCYGL
jgi:hypothetical protein